MSASRDQRGARGGRRRQPHPREETWPTRGQFAGCIVGQALGDALGCVVEGSPPDACREYVDTLLRPGIAGSRTRGDYPFGQYTDDTQLARELTWFAWRSALTS